MILDSGERRQFDSGAVRDIVDGKGRCDLLPLDIIANLIEDFELSVVFGADYINSDINKDLLVDVLGDIYSYINTGDATYLNVTIANFAAATYPEFITAILEVAKHYEQGCNKYGERNWEKGIPLHCYIDSGVRHLLKYMRGDVDEPHDRAFLWNMLGALWTAKHHPELIDLPFKEN